MSFSLPLGSRSMLHPHMQHKQTKHQTKQANKERKRYRQNKTNKQRDIGNTNKGTFKLICNKCRFGLCL